jgi:hypothetical protein
MRRRALVERSDVHRPSAVTAAFEVVPTLAFTLPAMAKGPSPETAHMRRRHRAILGRLETPSDPRSPPALRPRARVGARERRPIRPLRCVECGRVQAAPVARGWTAYITIDEEEPSEAIVCCPECSKREFGVA